MKVKSQAERFRRVRLVDIHGRPFTARQEIETGVPVDVFPLFVPLTLGNGARVLAPADVHVFDVNQPGWMGYDYLSWQAQVAAAEERWQQRLQEVAKSNYGDGWVQAVEHPTAMLLQLVGPKPIIPLEIVQACAEGNQWALGLRPEVPSWAKKYTVRTVAQQATGRPRFPDAHEEHEEAALRETALDDTLRGAASAVDLSDVDADDITLGTADAPPVAVLPVTNAPSVKAPSTKAPAAKKAAPAKKVAAKAKPAPRAAVGG